MIICSELVEHYDHGVSCLDTGLGRPGLAACYLLQQNGRLAIIETGVGGTVPRILQLIENLGYRRDDVDFIIITHVHLDHAGGAGGLMQALPNARLVVHPRGAKHMVNPEVLEAGAMAVYGEDRYRATYGELIPVPENRVLIADDEFELNFNGRQLKFFDTPGHARHHFCVYDPTSQGIFTGDTLGIVYRELCHAHKNFVMPSTTPVQFEPERLKASMQRLMSLNPRYFYLTHYGRVDATDDHVKSMHDSIDAYMAIAKKFATVVDRHQQITEALITYTLMELAKYRSPINAHTQEKLIAMDMSINAQGLEVWLSKEERQSNQGAQA